ncbi:MAG TPA: iron chelate uptake ABC transporter family permease subunit [Tissierellaceae bacterium]|nr:iron chelate uptake ABC transporter family permease subunit [Tissierellaceae bacterium]
MMDNKRKIVILTLISLAMTLAFVFWGLGPTNWRFFIQTRLPKVAAIAITGAAIGYSSLLFQTVSNNRILTPSVLGLDSLYMLLQTFVIFTFGSTSRVAVDRNLNFFITVILMVLFSTLLFKLLLQRESGNIMKLLLVGIIMGTLFSSLSSFMQMVIDPNEFMHVQDRMFASFNRVNTDILIVAMVITIGALSLTLKDTALWDVLTLGRDNAINLGVDYDRTIRRMLFTVSLLVSVSTALVGPITFLGMLVVNLAREMLNTFRHRELITGSILLGILFLVGGQLVVERVLNFSTPISVIINFVGGIYFIKLLLKESVG